MDKLPTHNLLQILAYQGLESRKQLKPVSQKFYSLLTYYFRDPVYLQHLPQQDRELVFLRSCMNEDLANFNFLFDTVNVRIAHDSALILAAKKGNILMIKALLKVCDPSSVNNFAIQLAAKHGNLNVVKELLKDPRVNPVDDDNYALKVAKKNGHDFVVNEIIQWMVHHEIQYDYENNFEIKELKDGIENDSLLDSLFRKKQKFSDYDPQDILNDIMKNTPFGKLIKDIQSNYSNIDFDNIQNMGQMMKDISGKVRNLVYNGEVDTNDLLKLSSAYFNNQTYLLNKK